MPYAVRTVYCTRCGVEMTGRYPPRGPWFCLPHAIDRIRENVRAQMTKRTAAYKKSAAAGRESAEQIRRRSGPAYEAWRRGMHGWMANLGRGTGL